MQIGLGSTLLARGLEHQQLDGIGYYTQELARCLQQFGCNWQPMVFGATNLTHIEQRPVHHLPRYSTAALLSAITGASFGGHSALRNQIDLFHAADHHIPRLPDIPVLATLMDAIPLTHTKWANPQFRTLKNKLWLKASRWADHVVTISEFAKTQISEHFDIAEEKISVVPLGVESRFYDRIDSLNLQAVFKAHNLQRSYFLCIGTLQPRKNIQRVIDAYLSLPNVLRQAHDLVIVGRIGWGSDQLVQQLRQFPPESGVRWLGRVPDLDKRALLQSASALVFPSLSEGFGLPVLEAFASQTPVITSNTTSLPELASEAALLIDPFDTSAIAHAMQQLVESPSLATQFRTQGLMRSRHYSWQNCAKQTSEIYQRMLGLIK